MHHGPDPSMAIFNDTFTQAGRIGKHLGLAGKFRAVETDSPMQAAVMRSVGGAAGAHRLVGHHALRGTEIYGVLTALAALRGAAIAYRSVGDDSGRVT